MSIMSKRTIIKGTLILTITGILTKCLGFYWTKHPFIIEYS